MSETTADFSKTHDVIVAGAGPAGCVLASRLSENPGRQVLLLEAGVDVAVPGAEHPDVLDPFCLSATYNPAFQWQGLVVEGATAAPTSDARAELRPFLQGYGVGGGSNMNGMAADRGLPEDYQEWSELGARGWDWQAVLPFFKKLEHDLDFPDVQSSSIHGASGPMPVRRLPRDRWAPFAAAFGEAMQQRGFAFLQDYMSDFREGFAAVPTNSLHDRRVSASMAYLTRAVRRRPNLTIVTNARVDRIDFDNRRATGVLANIAGAAVPLASLIMYLKRAATQAADNPWFLQNWLRFSSHHRQCADRDMHLMSFNKCAWHTLGRRVGMVAVSILKPYSVGTVQLASADPARLPKVHFNLFADARDEDRMVAGLALVFELLNAPGVASLRHDILAPKVARLAAGLSRRHAWNELKARAIWPLRSNPTGNERNLRDDNEQRCAPPPPESAHRTLGMRRAGAGLFRQISRPGRSGLLRQLAAGLRRV